MRSSRHREARSSVGFVQSICTIASALSPSKNNDDKRGKAQTKKAAAYILTKMQKHIIACSGFDDDEQELIVSCNFAI